MKTQPTNIEKEIKRNGMTLFNYYYNYVHPTSDLGLFRKLQELTAKNKQSSEIVKKI